MAMPIVLDPVPGNVIAPGMTVVPRSDVIGPIPPGGTISIQLFPVGEEQPCAGWAIPFPASGTLTKLAQEHHNIQTIFAAPGLITQVNMKLEISSGEGVFDQGTLGPFTYNPVALLPELLREQGSFQSGQGLTEEQATQLLETHESTFPVISVDSLTLREISSGPQGGVVSAVLDEWIYGVIVRIASVPPEFRVDTADEDYWTRSLAVIRIYRGSDLWKRVPVHTSSKLVSFVDEGLITAVAQIVPINWLLNITVQVSFASGVTGQVFLMRLP